MEKEILATSAVIKEKMEEIKNDEKELPTKMNNDIGAAIKETVLESEIVKEYGLTDLIESKLNSIKNIKQAKSGIVLLNKDKEQLEAEIPNLRGEILEEAKADLDKVNLELVEKQKIILDSKASINETKREIKSHIQDIYKAKTDEMKKRLEELSEDDSKLKDLKSEKVKQQQAIDQAKNAIDLLSKDKEQLEAEIPNLRGKILEEAKDDLDKVNLELAEKQREISDSEKSIEKIESDIKELIEKYKDREEKKEEKTENAENTEKTKNTENAENKGKTENAEKTKTGEPKTQENSETKKDQEEQKTEREQQKVSEKQNQNELEPTQDTKREASSEKAEVKISLKNDSVYINGAKIINLGIASSIYDRKELFKRLDINRTIREVIGKDNLFNRLFKVPRIKAKLDPTIIKMLNMQIDKKDETTQISEEIGMNIKDYVTSIYTKEALPIKLSYDLQDSKLSENNNKKMQKIAKEVSDIEGVEVKGLPQRVKKGSFYTRLVNSVRISGLIEDRSDSIIKEPEPEQNIEQGNNFKKQYQVKITNEQKASINKHIEEYKANQAKKEVEEKVK